MYCLRCGKETEEEQAFCLDCQKEMAKYPVDPNAVVQIPVQKQSPPKKPVRRKATPEEQVRMLTRRLRICVCVLFAALVMIVILSVPVIRDYGKKQFQIGQNYSTVKPSPVPTEIPAETE